MDISPHICTVISRQLNNGVLTPKELADGMGVTESTVSRWRYRSIPSSGKWKRLAHLLGVSVHELLQGSQHEEDSESCENTEDLRSKYIRALELNAELNAALHKERRANEKLKSLLSQA